MSELSIAMLLRYEFVNTRIQSLGVVNKRILSNCVQNLEGVCQEQQQRQPTEVQLQDIALKGMCCLLLSFVAIPHDYDLSQREGNARLPPNVKTKILNEHYMMAYKVLKDYARNNGTGRNRQERTSRKD